MTPIIKRDSNRYAPPFHLHIKINSHSKKAQIVSPPPFISPPLFLRTHPLIDILDINEQYNSSRERYFLFRVSNMQHYPGHTIRKEAMVIRSYPLLSFPCPAALPPLATYLCPCLSVCLSICLLTLSLSLCLLHTCTCTSNILESNMPTSGTRA